MNSQEGFAAAGRMSDYMDQGLGAPFTLASGSVSSDHEPRHSFRFSLSPDETETQQDALSKASSQSSTPRAAVTDRGNSPSRPPLVASIEARRKSLNPGTGSTSSRIFDMGPPSSHINTSPSSSQSSLSAGESASTSYLQLPRVEAVMKEKDATLSITITCNDTGTHVNFSESPQQVGTASASLLLSAMEDAKDKILRARNLDLLRCKPKSNVWHSTVEREDRSTSDKKRRYSVIAEEDKEVPKKLKRASNSGDNIFGLMSSDAYLKHLLTTFGRKGYTAMNSEQRESLFMATLSSTYSSFSNQLHKARAFLDRLQKQSIVYLGQRDEALSRLADTKERLEAQVRQNGKSRDTIRRNEPADVEWRQSRSHSAPSLQFDNAEASRLNENAGHSSSAPTAILTSKASKTSPRSRHSRDPASSGQVESLGSITLQPGPTTDSSDTSSNYGSTGTSAASSPHLQGNLASQEVSSRQPLLEYRDVQSASNNTSRLYGTQCPLGSSVMTAPNTAHTPSGLPSPILSNHSSLLPRPCSDPFTLQSASPHQLSPGFKHQDYHDSASKPISWL
ncbi:unnamed protein product [Sympodiomycopsis kandeliae]